MIRVILLFAALASAAHAGDLPRESRVPGGIALVEIPGGELPPTALIDTRRAAVIRHDDRWLAIVGLPLSTKPGPHRLKVATSEGTVDVPFEVTDKRYRTQNLTIKDQRKVDPAPEDLKRIEAESKRSDAALSKFTTGGTPAFALQSPVAGQRSDSYGSRRAVRIPGWISLLPRARRSGRPQRAPWSKPATSSSTATRCTSTTATAW
jgi:hypothetical protein